MIFYYLTYSKFVYSFFGTFHFGRRMCMSTESIKELLETVCRFNTVNIVQVFSDEKEDVVVVSCLKNSSMLKITFLREQTTEYIDNIEKATTLIDLQVNQKRYS